MEAVEINKKQVTMHPRMQLKSWRQTVTVKILSLKSEQQIKNLYSLLGIQWCVHAGWGTEARAFISTPRCQ
jgi:hypothetical protein